MTELNKYMVLLGGRPAKHKLGDIGRKEDDFIRVFREDEEYFIGNFTEGFGFIDVKYKKVDCRNLTVEEVDKLNGKWFGVNGDPHYQISIDYDGNLVERKFDRLDQWG
ncbi:hypothetical protein [Paenibacillus pini]|uniref:Uncharacterized protein n=1 Tax=Paenibacillus pini JCM 16418 TaxID=1236976 RepID=W7YPK0_9BACL|nr:hypothetical protein [Paenibacillus pini]GAF10392.1 hypothetical protein JCM16418_4594 [Paenibacillus pini JCM 16418]